MVLLVLVEMEEGKGENRANSDFSIDHILNRAGNNIAKNKNEVARSVSFENFSDCSALDQFSWLQCTRYCPPKIPRSQKREGPQRRQLGRHPRIPFTSHQLSILEEKFQQSQYLSSEEVTTLSRKLNLADIRVKIWFQNRRARERREHPGTSSESASPDRKNLQNYSGIGENISQSTVIYNNFQSNLIRQTNLHQYFEQLVPNFMPGILPPPPET